MARKVPFHEEAEQAVLGSVFLEPKVLVNVIDRLEDKDFYDVRHVLILKAMISLYNEGLSIDYNTVSSKLEASESLMKAGGIDYILQLSDSVVTTLHLDSYIDFVKDASLKRQIIEVTSAISMDGYQKDLSAKEYLEEAEEKIFAIAQKRKVSEFAKIADIINQVKEKLEKNMENRGGITGLYTGFEGLDHATLGFQPQELIILAARPAMGKSAFAMNLAINVARRNQKATVAIFSLEMSNEQLATRMLSSESNVDSRKIRNASVDSNDWLLIGGASNTLGSLNVLFDDSAAVTVSDIRAKCRKISQEKGLDFVVIDYLQLIKTDDGRQNRQEEVAKISRSLKQMARELNVPVLALSQLSREVDKREEKKPVLADLRESGSIEQDADIVIFLYREDYYNKEKEKSSNDTSITELIIAKNRQGSLANIKFNFMLGISRFQEQKIEIGE